VINGLIDFDQVGPVSLGMSTAEAAKALNTPVVFVPDKACPYLDPSFVGLQLSANQSGTVVGCYVSAPGSFGPEKESAQARLEVTTPAGIGVGSTRDEVLAAYGDKAEPRPTAEPEDLPPLDPEDLLVRSGPGDQDYVIVFRSKDGVVLPSVGSAQSRVDGRLGRGGAAGTRGCEPLIQQFPA
jgi:hypothetical protein